MELIAYLFAFACGIGAGFGLGARVFAWPKVKKTTGSDMIVTIRAIDEASPVIEKLTKRLRALDREGLA